MDYDLTVEQGVTWQYVWPITDADGAPVNLTGYTAKSQVRANAYSTEVLHEWSTALGTIVLSGSQVALLVAPATSLAWGWREGVYDIKLTSPVGDVSTVSRGKIYIQPSVTR